MSEIRKRDWSNPNSIYNSPQHKEKLLLNAKTNLNFTMKGKKQSEKQKETARQVGLKNKGRKFSQEVNKKKGLSGNKNPNYGNSEPMKKLWQDPEYREKTIKAQLQGLFKRPTSLEKEFIDFIEKYSLPFNYCGNGSLLIGFKNPDFVEDNGRKLCIEVANEFHHQGNYAEKRIEHFKKYGWECLVLFFERNKDQKWISDESDLFKEVSKFVNKNK